MIDSLTVIILSYNEEIHIERAIQSASSIAESVLVVDSGSSDSTVAIATRLGARVLFHSFVNQAEQFNWALEQVKASTEWVFRLDADEVITDSLARGIFEALPAIHPEVAGIEIGRRITFLGRPIRWGGLFPIQVVRLFRFGKGKSEERWMDEHIVVDGLVGRIDGELLDDNLKSLSWWIDKHNRYASREVIEMLDAEFHFLNRVTETQLGRTNANAKRWIKDNLYGRVPSCIRAFAYFIYRYILRAGVLDGREGLLFHVLQGFWYRFLVDAKHFEVVQHMKRENVDARSAIRTVLEVEV